MTKIEEVESLAAELYDWEGRYGTHKCILWADLNDKDKSSYFEEALFIRDEFCQLFQPDDSWLLTDKEINFAHNNEQDRLGNFGMESVHDCEFAVAKAQLEKIKRLTGGNE